MNTRIVRLFVALMLCLAPGAFASAAQTYLLTDYPAFTAKAGDSKSLGLTLRNDSQAPVRASLDVEGLPQGWKATWLGNGQPIAAVQAGPESSVALQLRLDIPKEASGQAPQSLTLVANTGDTAIRLPLQVQLAETLPASLDVETRLPSLRGAPRAAFDFQFTVRNNSGTDIVAQLEAEAPENFATHFTESYGSQQITSVPLKAGASKDLKLSVRPPARIEAGEYPVKIQVRSETLQAAADVKLDIVGQPQLRLTGRDGRLSGQAQVGRTDSLPVVLVNDGTATATDITLSGSGPSGWKITFEPKTVASLAPGEQIEAQAHITPSERSLVGDYMATLRAATQGESTSSEFRITVKSSSLWGAWGVGIIAIAVLILVGAVARFGRR